MEGFKIASGGRLLRTDWVYDRVSGEGAYITKDVTDDAPRYLLISCTLEEGVILKDIFQLLKRHLEVYKLVMPRPVEEIVEEGLQPYTGEEIGLDYVELYWQIDYDQAEKDFSGNTLPDFHGISLSAEYGFALDFIPANKIAGLPLKLCPKFTIYNATDRTSATYEGPKFSLGQILYGIIWELTWYGPPAKRDEESARLKQSLALRQEA
jgi:hypothetical protein